MPTDFSMVAGTPAQLSSVLTPPNGTYLDKPVWASDNAGAVLTPTADGLNCQVDVAPGQAFSTFNVSLSVASTDPSVGTVSVSHTITVSQPTPPPPPALTGIDFVQTS